MIDLPFLSFNLVLPHANWLIFSGTNVAKTIIRKLFKGLVFENVRADTWLTTQDKTLS